MALVEVQDGQERDDGFRTAYGKLPWAGEWETALIVHRFSLVTSEGPKNYEAHFRRGHNPDTNEYWWDSEQIYEVVNE